MSAVPSERPAQTAVRGGVGWAPYALIASGIVIIVAATPTILFFVGLLFVALGVYVWARAHPRGKEAHEPRPNAYPGSADRTEAE